MTREPSAILTAHVGSLPGDQDDRSEVFLETKIWISDYGREQTLHGFEKSARKLGVDQIDLLILHQARLAAAKAALDELDVLGREDWTRAETVERLRRFYDYRKSRFAARAGKIEDDGYEGQTLAYQQTLQRLLAAQRGALLQMRSDGHLSNEAMNRILRELDLEESRLEI